MENNRPEQWKTSPDTKPSDYQEIKSRLKELEEENNRLKLYLKYGDVSVIETTVQEFQVFTRAKLKRIVRDYQLLDAGRNERHTIQLLIKFLDDTIEELQNLIGI